MSAALSRGRSVEGGIYRKSSQTPSPRDRVLNAAHRLFAKNGYDQTTTAAIARAAHTSESQIVKYFESKAGLLIALLDRGWAAVLSSVAAGTDSPTAADNLETLFRNLVDRARQDPAFFSVATVDSYRLAMLASEHARLVGFNPLMELIRSLIPHVSAPGQPALCCAILSVLEGSVRHQLFETRKDCVCADEDLIQVVGATLRTLLDRNG